MAELAQLRLSTFNKRKSHIIETNLTKDALFKRKPKIDTIITAGPICESLRQRLDWGWDWAELIPNSAVNL